jgi:type II secretory pathway pseudopilin PulG
MNPEPPKTPREELELRLTALLLGELSEYGAANVREAIAKDPELAKLHDDLKQTIRLIRLAATNADQPAPTEVTQLSLSEERRKKLLTAFAIPPLKEKDRKPKRVFQVRLIEALAVLAMAALLASVTLPNFVKSRTTSQSNAIVNNLRQLDGAKQQWALQHGKSANDVPTMKDLSPYLKGVSPVMGERYVLGKVAEPVAAELDADKARKQLGKVTWRTWSASSFVLGWSMVLCGQ